MVAAGAGTTACMRTWLCLGVALFGCVDSGELADEELAVAESESLVYQDPPPQLLAGYQLDSNGVDWGPLGINARIVGGVTASVDRRNRIGRAMHFHDNEYLAATVEGPFDRDAITITMWIRQANLPPNYSTFYCNSATLVAKYNWFYEPTNAFDLRLVSCPQTALQSLVFMYDNAQGGLSKVETGYTLSVLRKWTHIAVSRASGVVKLYVNGQLVRTAGHAGPAMYNNRKVTIGGTAGYYPSNDFWGLNGDMDDVRFFANQLTDSQIAALAVY